MEKKLDSVRQSFEDKKHLDPIIKDYDIKVAELCKPHTSWYNIDKPKLDPQKILSANIQLNSVKMDQIVDNVQIPIEANGQ